MDTLHHEIATDEARKGPLFNQAALHAVKDFFFLILSYF
jgi:hypothetical protein